MIEIHRNGSGKPVINIGDIIKIVILLGAAVVFYFTNQVPTVRTLENHEVRISQTEDDIDEHSEEIRELDKTKVDKK